MRPTCNTCKHFAMYPGETYGYCTIGHNDIAHTCEHCGLTHFEPIWTHYTTTACDNYQRGKAKRMTYNQWKERGKPIYVSPHDMSERRRKMTEFRNIK
jgi:hypothetical protein